MKSISNSNSNSIEPYRNSIFKKGYVKIFILGINLLFIGFILTTSIYLIPVVSYLEAGYDDYVKLLRYISSVSLLFRQIGVLLFSASSFIGALSDIRLSGEVKRGMIIASSIGILAIIIMTLFPIYTPPIIFGI